MQDQPALGAAAIGEQGQLLLVQRLQLVDQQGQFPLRLHRAAEVQGEHPHQAALAGAGQQADGARHLGALETRPVARARPRVGREHDLGQPRLLRGQLAVEGGRIGRALLVEGARARRLAAAFGRPAAPVGGAGAADRARHRRVEAREMPLGARGVAQLGERQPAGERLGVGELDAARRLGVPRHDVIGAGEVAAFQRGVHRQLAPLEGLRGFGLGRSRGGDRPGPAAQPGAFQRLPAGVGARPSLQGARRRAQVLGGHPLAHHVHKRPVDDLAGDGIGKLGAKPPRLGDVAAPGGLEPGLEDRGVGAGP